MRPLKSYQNQIIFTKENEIANGDYIIEGFLIIRTNKGYLSDVINPDTNEVLPAVENDTMTHIEHWKNGVLHAPHGTPAIIDLEDNICEYWENGKHVEPPAIDQYEREE